MPSIFPPCAAALAALGFTVLTRPDPWIVWNCSQSLPTGIYAILAAPRPRAGQILLLKPPAALADYLAYRAYLPRGLPLLKRVAAGAGDHVCRHGTLVTINGTAAAVALARDSRRRPLPIWSGCARLTAGQLFVLNKDRRDSFDSRYFGALPISAVLGRAVPLLTKAGP